MLRAVRVDPQGHWPQEGKRGSVTLAYDDRHRRRMRLSADTQEALLLDLPQAAVLREGDGLMLDGEAGWIEVHAAREPLLEVTAADPLLLLRLAWHLGNRHLPVEIVPARLLIRPDHVIAGMIRGLGGQVREIAAPFTPEGGAYGPTGHGHHHHGDGPTP